MKKELIFISLVVLLTNKTYAEQLKDKIKTSVENELIFQKDRSCLKGLKSIVIMPSLNIQSVDLEKKVYQVLKEKLSKVGNLVEKQLVTKSGIDLEGLGAPGRLNLMVKTIIPDMESPEPIIWTSLQLSTSVKVERTQIECESTIWDSNGFAKGWLNSKNSDNVIYSINQALNEFLLACSLESSKEEKVIFYLYLP